MDWTLIGLTIVVAGALAAYAFFFLAPPASTPPVKKKGGKKKDNSKDATTSAKSPLASNSSKAVAEVSKSVFGITTTESGEEGLKEHEIPIDITYKKLLTWLVDRKKVSNTWNRDFDKIQKTIEQTISKHKRKPAAFASLAMLPADHCISYERCEQALNEFLNEDGIDTTKSGLLRSSYVNPLLYDWDSICSTYKKNNVHIGAASRALITNTSYEIPSIKKTAERLNKQISECSRKETDYTRQATDYKQQFEQKCSEIGIKGENISQELKDLVTHLDEHYHKIADLVQKDIIAQILDFYVQFTQYTHSAAKSETVINKEDVCVTLMYIHCYGNERSTTMLQRRQGLLPSDAPEPPLPSAQSTTTTTATTTNNNNAVDEIDFDISAMSLTGATNSDETVNEADIDFDISAMSLTAETAETTSTTATEGELDLDIDFDISTPAETGGEIDFDITAIDFNSSDNNVEVSDSTEIDWDIGVVGVGEDADEFQFGSSDETILSDAVTRNQFADDLYELQAFLETRLSEAVQSDAGNMAMMMQLQNTPNALKSVDQKTIAKMAEHLEEIREVLTSERFVLLCEIKASKRFVDRLAQTIRQKMDSSLRCKSLVNEMVQKQEELQAESALVLPKLNALLEETRNLKAWIEKELSKQYSNRPVHIIGAINTILR